MLMHKKVSSMSFVPSAVFMFAFIVGSFFTSMGTVFAAVNPTTMPASSVTTADATLNAQNGDASDNTSFWWGTSTTVPFIADANPAPQLPSGWSYHPSGTGAKLMGESFSHIISGLTPNTPYYFVSWSLIGGVWNPGAIETFTTVAIPDTTAPTIPSHVFPADNSTYSTLALGQIDWTDSIDTESSPVTYIYQSAIDPTLNPDGSFVTPIYTSGVLTNSHIVTAGTPAGVYYWHVKAVDSATIPNSSDWTAPYKVTVDNTPPPVPSCTANSFDTGIVGSVNGQEDWESTGPFDQSIVENNYGYNSFGCKSIRISNSVTSGSFGDQTFTYSVANEAGESVSTNGGKSGGVRQNHFEAEFDFATTTPVHQPGLALSVSPDRGDGSRMSYLQLKDEAAGVTVIFYDTPGTTSPANFSPTTIATGLSRLDSHTIKFVVDYLEGPSNDIVKIYVDGILVHTGTTWENYFRYDVESAAEQTPRTTDSLIFRASGTAVPANAGNGFLFDNFDLSTGDSLKVTTDSASSLASTSAVLNAINGEFNATNTSFWWGETAATSFTADVNPGAQLPLGWNYHPVGTGSKSIGAPFSHAILSLTPLTPYYFVSWSQVGGVWYPGAVATFTTEAPDTTAPTADIVFPTPGPSATSFEVVFNEDVVETEAEDPANYFLTNWPGAGGSGDLVGDATIVYDSMTKTATVTLTNIGWYISAEQQWGVQNINDISGNVLVSPYSEYSTLMTAPVTVDSGIDTNWHNTPVTLTLNCSDTFSSGCKKTYYTTDGTTPTTSSLFGNSFTLSADGIHTVKYFSVDNAGNEEGVQTALNTVKIDSVAPVTVDSGIDTNWHNTPVTVTLTCDDSSASGCGTTYYTTNGSTPTTLSASGNSFTLNADGVYTINYFSVDNAGNAESVKTATNTVKIDTVIPVITLLGDASVVMNAGQTYTDAGATANDVAVGDITSSIVKVSTVNTSVVGVYTVTYNVADSAGNNAVEVSRTVTVNRAPSRSSGGFLRSSAPSTGGQVLGASSFNFTLKLSLGSKGQEVTELQKFLNEKGFDCGTVDGVFGLKTKSALIKFQIANGLVGDGIVGPLTRAVLNK
jgi:hypothetical protein